MTAFDDGLRGRSCRLDLGGVQVELPVERWHAPADETDRVLVDACGGPTIDLGCGPGRLVAALVRRGVPALGVDSSEVAVRLACSRGAPALRRDVLGDLPGAGRWSHVLLADGNIGIGGDPVALLRRARDLLVPTGTALVEVDPPGCGLRRERARVHSDGAPGDWFDWAVLDPAALGDAADEAGFRTRRVTERAGRWFAELAPS
jgi:SAM-dependent methyltransferase